MKCQAIGSDQDQGMQLQQLQTDTQPETPSKEAQGNLENNVHRSQDIESLEQLVDMEISEEHLESTAVPANNLLLSQNRGGFTSANREHTWAITTSKSKL